MKCSTSPFTTALFIWIVAIALAGGGASIPTPGQAASLSKADKAALKEAFTACKAQAKGKKIRLLARRKYVNDCVAEALKDRPSIDVVRLLKAHPDMQDLPTEQWDAF